MPEQDGCQGMVLFPKKMRISFFLHKIDTDM